MIFELAHIAVIIATLLSLFSILVFIFNVYYCKSFYLDLIEKFSILNFLLILFGFFVLEYAFISSDFSLILVANNSHSTKPLIYKMSGLWGNHEGSIYLWILILSLFTYLLSINKSITNQNFKINILGVQNIILFLFLVFLLFTSNPFIRNEDPPLEGLGLNPLLQDPGLAFHPPMLYVGYVGLSISFSIAVAFLLNKKIDLKLLNHLKPWTLLAWSFLTCGIALGSWWAYYELGWGGWWFWDPVENASLMPWLISTALIHSITVTQNKKDFENWTILLAILGFSFSLLGTFIVRSGLLTSVHAFASDPTRGIFILIILAFSTCVPLILFAFKKSYQSQNKYFILSRETGLLINNIFLVTSTLTVLIGTMYPLILETINNSKISIGPSYYNATFSIIMIPFILAMAIAPFLAWKNTSIKLFSKNLFFLITLSILTTIIIFLFNPSEVFGIICGYLSIILFLSVILAFLKKQKNRRLLPLNFYGMLLAHLGLAIFLSGVTGEQFFKKEHSAQLKINDEIKIGKYSIKLNNIEKLKIENYVSNSAQFIISKKDDFVGYIKSEQRFYPVEKNNTTEAGIHSFFLSDLYITLGEGNMTEGWVVQAYFNPLVKCIWFGTAFMALGGILSLCSNSNRKYI